MVDDRKLDVLRAIVEDYVATEEPVGSKALVERHGLGVSPATVRNDMAALEEEGYIHQPHTSAGRVPTDKGYRLFVDKLATLKPMSAAERRAISTLLDGAVDLDDVVQRSVRLLSQLTRQVAIVQYPTLSRSTVRHVELVALTPTRVMVILILSTGRVEQRLVELDGPIADADLADLRVAVNQATGGVHIAAAAAALSDLPESVRHEHADPTRAVVTVLTEAMSDHRSDERVAVSGTANLARYGDFDTAVRPLLEALEEHVVLLKLLGESGVDAELAATSVVATGYGPQEFHLGSLGVVGPTRMDYPGSMAAVRAVARYVSRILDEGNQ
jgi:heat-inducible transcriptional repressor